MYKSCLKSITLNTGATMPLLGFGTYMTEETEKFEVALRTALDCGYRLIDTAHIYKNESVIGEVLQEYFDSGKLQREDIFITTKLPFYAMTPEDAEKCIEEQLKALQLEYIDLYLIHMPMPMKPKDMKKIKPLPGYYYFYDVPHIDTWRVLEKYYNDGFLKAIGLCNFNEQQIAKLWPEAEVKPANLQCECSVYWPQFELQEECNKRDIAFTAYGPFGNPSRPDVAKEQPLEEPVILKLAEKYNKTPAQIILRYLIQRRISVIPKSLIPERVIENSQVFDFHLSSPDVNRINEIKTRVRLADFQFAYDHKDFPFPDVRKPLEENNEEES